MKAAAKKQERLPMTKREKWETMKGYMFISPYLIGFIAFTLVPLLFSLYSSFTYFDMTSTQKWVGVKNYVNIFTSDENVRIGLYNTVYYVIFSVPAVIILALLIALMLNMKIWLTSIFRTVYYLPSVLSGVAVYLLWQWIFDPSNGKEIPFQRVHSSATAGGRCKICFLAELPALGYRLYTLKKVAAPTCYPKVLAADNTLENEMLRLTIDGETGYIKSLYRKDVDMEMLLEAGAVPLVIDDHSDTWSHNVRRYENLVGKMKATQVTLLEEGPVKSVIRVVSSYGTSKLVQDFAVYKDQPFVEVRAVADWHEKFKVLKLQFPLSLIFRKSLAELPYGMTERAMDGDEYPMQTWVDVSGEVRGRGQEIVGVTFLNDGKSSYSIENTKVNLILNTD